MRIEEISSFETALLALCLIAMVASLVVLLVTKKEETWDRALAVAIGASIVKFGIVILHAEPFIKITLYYPPR